MRCPLHPDPERNDRHKCYHFDTGCDTEWDDIERFSLAEENIRAHDSGQIAEEDERGYARGSAVFGGVFILVPSMRERCWRKRAHGDQEGSKIPHSLLFDIDSNQNDTTNKYKDEADCQVKASLSKLIG